MFSTFQHILLRCNTTVIGTVAIDRSQHTPVATHYVPSSQYWEGGTFRMLISLFPRMTEPHPAVITVI